MSKVKEKANPALEFKGDAMMCEIHENRLKMFEATKLLRPAARIAVIRKKACEFRRIKK